jgi:hypothetical protein
MKLASNVEAERRKCTIFAAVDKGETRVRELERSPLVNFGDVRSRRNAYVTRNRSVRVELAEGTATHD